MIFRESSSEKGRTKMKTIMHKLFAVLMALLMTVSVINMPVWNTQAEEPEEITESFTYINPVYAPEAQRESDADIQIYDRSVYESAIAHIREEMVKRSAEISVQLDYEADYRDVAHYLIDEAVGEYTSSPKESDYLKFQYGGYSASISYDYQRTYAAYTYTMRYYTDAAQEETVDAAVKSLIDELGIAYKNDYQKVKAVYEWIADHVEYEYNYDSVDTDLIYAAYGALIDRKAVCQGYSVLFFRMMRELGIDCRVISGIGNGGNHAWNIVKLGNKYYNIDSTWAATAENKPAYFLRGSSYFPDHSADSEYKTSDFTSEYPIDPNNYVPSEGDLDTGDVIQGAVLNADHIELDEGKTYQLTAAVLPETFSQRVTWSSSDSSIASVTQTGLVTAVSAGTAVIAAKAQAGGKDGTCKVTVTKLNPDAGHSYAIRTITDHETNWGDLIFFRSKEDYTADGETWQTATDLYGNEYEGFVVAKDDEIEGPHCDYPEGKTPWFYHRFAVLRIYVGENQIIHPQNMEGWFKSFKQLREFDGRGFDLSKCISLTDLFYDCDYLKTVNFSNADTSNLRTMGGMFWRCRVLEEVDLSSFNTSRCTSIGSLFEFCGQLKKVNLSSFDTSGMDGGMRTVFNGANALQEIKLSSKWTVWSDDSYLPEGTWSNGTIEKTEKELYAQYPANASAWAGTWKKISTPVHVTKIEVDPYRLQLNEGQTGTLKATVSPSNADNKNIIWESGDPDIASVDQNGKVTAIKEGSTVIYARAQENPDVNGWCSLTVKKESAPVPSSITLNRTSAEMATQSTLRLSASVLPADADQSVTWTSSDESVATVSSSGTVTAHRYGTVTITARSVSNPSLSASCRIQTRFYDVNDPSKYYYSHVYWAADMNITTGYDRVYFGPQRNCTRRELCIFLYRMMGRPAVSGELEFSDTKDKYSKTSDSYKAILWCYNRGIVKGYSDGTFRPDASIIRKDVMIMLYRLAGRPAVSGSMTFPDVRAQGYSPNSDTYKSIIWGTQTGITKGYSDGNFQPLSNCLREHIVTFIHRFYNK